MADQNVATELKRAEDARKHLTEDVTRIAHTARAVVHDRSRIVRYVGFGLLAATALAVVAAGTVALLRRRSPRNREPTARPLWMDIGRKVLLGATGPVATHLTRRWLLNPPSTTDEARA